ncbi:MAG: hypothetical protein ACP5JY_02755 [Candidatus Nanoarchaeia archaeon]
MPPIRTMIIATTITILASLFLLSFVGGFAIDNHASLPSSITNLYQSYQTNATKAINILSASSSNGQNGLQSQNIVSGIFSGVGLAMAFGTAIPAAFSAILNLIAIPIAMLGIPTGIAMAVAVLLISAMIVLAILSAIFIYSI